MKTTKSVNLDESSQKKAKSAAAAAAKAVPKAAAKTPKLTLGQRIANLGKYEWDFEAMKRA